MTSIAIDRFVRLAFDRRFKRETRQREGLLAQRQIAIAKAGEEQMAADRARSEVATIARWQREMQARRKQLFDPDPAPVAPPAHVVVARRMADSRKLILAWLADHPESTATAAASALGFGIDKARGHLSQLAAAGKVGKRKNGAGRNAATVYWIVENDGGAD